MKYRILVYFFLFLKALPCYSQVEPEPIFAKLIKKYDVKNKQNLNKRIIVKGQEHFETPKPPQIEDVWTELAPELSSEVSNEIAAYQKDHTPTPWFSSPRYVNEQQQSNRLESIKDSFLKHYLDKKLLNGFVVKKLKENNPSLGNLENGVKKLSGEDVPSAPAPALSPEEAKLAQEAALKAAQEDTWKIDTGTRVDWLRQRSRAWFNCSYFNTEAKMDAGGFSKFNYEVKLSRSLELSEDKHSPFGLIETSVLVNKDDSSGNIRTHLTEHLQLNYQSLFNRKDNIVHFNYSILF